MADEISDATFERVRRLVEQFAHLCNRTNVEVVHALLATRTLAQHGYTQEQGGRLTERQGKAAEQVLLHWIRSKSGDIRGR